MFMPPSIPARHNNHTEHVQSHCFSHTVAAPIYLESYVFCPGPHCIQNSYLASISPLLKPFPFCNLIKLTKRSLF